MPLDAAPQSPTWLSPSPLSNAFRLATISSASAQTKLSKLNWRSSESGNAICLITHPAIDIAVIQNNLFFALGADLRKIFLLEHFAKLDQALQVLGIIA